MGTDLGIFSCCATSKFLLRKYIFSVRKGREKKMMSSRQRVKCKMRRKTVRETIAHEPRPSKLVGGNRGCNCYDTFLWQLASLDFAFEFNLSFTADYVQLEKLLHFSQFLMTSWLMFYKNPWCFPVLFINLMSLSWRSWMIFRLEAELIGMFSILLDCSWSLYGAWVNRCSYLFCLE